MKMLKNKNKPKTAKRDSNESTNQSMVEGDKPEKKSKSFFSRMRKDTQRKSVTIKGADFKEETVKIGEKG